MLGLGGLLLIGFFLFWVWAIYDVATVEPSQVRNLPKLAWVVIVVVLFPFLFDIGPFLWVLLGRPARVASPNHPQGQRRPRRSPEPQPDIDLQGQRVVTDRRSAELDRMLEEWERARRDEGASDA